MTTAEAMAVAVLKGDLTAARALADHLTGELNQGEPIPPVRTLGVSVDRVRVVLHSPHERRREDTVAQVDALVRRWLGDDGSPSLVLSAGWRIDLYELPEPSPPQAGIHAVGHTAGAAGGIVGGVS